MKKRYIALLATLGMAATGAAVPMLTASAQEAGSHASAGTAGAKYDQFIVTFDKSATSRRISHLGVRQLRQLSTGGLVVKTSQRLDATGARQMMADLARQPGVAGVEPDLIMRKQFVPNDTLYPQQWDLFEPAGGINAPAAWDTADGAGVTVAVIDTGITPHSDLNANVQSGGYDFISDPTNGRDGDGRDANPNDEGDHVAVGECGATEAEPSSWHGSHVAGTIAAVSNNGNGVAGIARAAKILPVRVLGPCGGTTSDIADAITWASGGKVRGVPNNTHPAKVINLSLGGSGACGGTFQSAINGATRRGTTVVIAAGNSNADVSGFSPANCNNVVAVASNDREGNRAFYSNFGAKVDVTAPGGEVRLETEPPGTRSIPQNGILSTLNAGTTTQAGETYNTYMGTSMAAPHVAGLVALVLGERSMSPCAVEWLLKAHARAVRGSCTGGCGAGIIDAAATIGAL
jgi:serine protease